MTTANTRSTANTRNVFFVGIDVDSMGGSQRVLHTLAQGLGRRGHRVEMIGIRTSPEPFRYNAEPAYRHTTLYQQQQPPPWRPKSLGSRLSPAGNLRARAARKEREVARALLTERLGSVPDGYVVFGSPWAADWALSLPWPHLKGIGQYHESIHQARSSANQRLIQRHYPRLDKSLFLSEGDAHEFRKLRLPNVGAMPNPLSFFPAEPAPLDAPRIAAVGRLDRVKRLDRLITAFAAATTDHTEWELHLFGDGPQEESLRELAEEQGVADRVVFRGRVDDMESAYRTVSVLALTSEREGRPMAVAEASACGVPPVAFEVSDGVSDLVAHEQTGLLVPPGEMDEFAAALRRLVEDGDLRRQYGAAAREHVADLSVDPVLDRWEALFDEIDR